jgi:hypothetical protein
VVVELIDGLHVDHHVQVHYLGLGLDLDLDLVHEKIHVHEPLDKKKYVVCINRC